jgi:hypothetical protein
MAKAKGGIQGYTVQEAQNVSIGQAGTAYLDDADIYTPPVGNVVVAIQAVGADCTLAAGTVSESKRYVDFTNASTSAANGDAMGALVLAEGTTIYGRWTTVGITATSQAILYLG